MTAEAVAAPTPNRAQRRAFRWQARRVVKHVATMPAKLRAIRSRRMHDIAQASRERVLVYLRERRELMDTVPAEFLTDEERAELRRQKTTTAKAIAGVLANNPANQT